MADRTRTDLEGVVEVTVPLRHEFASSLRVLAAATGADSGFSIDDIDDLRLALSEVFTILVELGDDARCRAEFVIENRQISITLGRDRADDVIELDALASTILSSVVDECTQSDGTITLVKRASA